jgi:hypothetical protein
MESISSTGADKRITVKHYEQKSEDKIVLQMGQGRYQQAYQFYL